MFNAILGKLMTTIRFFYAPEPVDRPILQGPKRIYNKPIMYQWSKLALVGLDPRTGRKVDPRDAAKAAKDTLVKDTPELMKIYEDCIDFWCIQMGGCVHPVDLAAHIIVACARGGPASAAVEGGATEALRDNISLGVGLGNLALLTHQLPPITRTIQDTPEFVAVVKECVSSDKTDANLRHIYSLPLRRYLEQVLRACEPMCQGCGMTESAHKQLAWKMAKTQAVEAGDDPDLVPEPKGMMTCTSCRLVHYCGRVCQKKDWSNSHKAFCLENKVAIPTLIGRLFQNEVDDPTDPMAVQKAMAKRSCKNCGTTELDHKKRNPHADDLRACSWCKNVLYCSRGCQKENWEIHAKECRESCREA